MEEKGHQSQSERASTLAAAGAGADEIRELEAYDDNAFDRKRLPRPVRLPLDGEPHVAAWRRTVERAGQEGAAAALGEMLVQLRFPVAEGISDSDDYRAATRRGADPSSLAAAVGLELESPGRLELLVHETPAGAVPVIVARSRADFVALIQAVAHRNEPVPVPDSQGALMVAGYNNWARIRDYRRRWQAENPMGSWGEEFKKVVARPELYKDQFILLSDGPYSAVPAADLGLADDEWRDLSVRIRMDHECTHYATRRLLGSMRNRALDEIIADYMGLVGATGRCRPEWALRFFGLEAFPDYRAGGRLENYRGEPPLSDGAFRVLQRLVRDAVHNLGAFDERLDADDRQAGAGAVVLLALTSLTVTDMAAADGTARLSAALEDARELVEHGN